MPRHLRVEFPGAIYHVTIRGNARQKIFNDDHDRKRFLQRLADSVETYGERLYLFCLMSNHVHLVVETPSANLRKFMQSLETGYTVYYNLRHDTCGHLFQGRYRAKLVEGDEYLLKLSRYVHLNPIFVGSAKSFELKERIERLRNYRWSSYRGYIGQDKPLPYVKYGALLAQTGVKPRRQALNYRQYVEDGLAGNDEEFNKILKGPTIGGDAFCARIRAAWQDLAGKVAQPEDIDFRYRSPTLESQTVLETISRHMRMPMGAFRERRRNSLLRPMAAQMLLKYAGLTNRATAVLLNLHSGEAAGIQARKAQAAQKQDKQTQCLMEAIEGDLRQHVSGQRKY
ncbi:MAG: transposase [Kiritimatiellae bacterium]|nr:transposase [Kiritimatiellia bacterium]